MHHVQELLAKIQPTVRRDCNYSNLDKIKSDAYYDEDDEKWIIPDLFISKTNLPSAGGKCNFVNVKREVVFFEYIWERN